MKVEHHGYAIEFREDLDVWECRTLELQSKSLKTLRTKINEVLAAARRLASVPLYRLAYGGIIPVNAVLIDAEPKNVWVMGSRWLGIARRNVLPERFKALLSELVARNAVNAAAIAEAKRLREEAAALRARSVAILAAIPRVTLDELRAITPEAVEKDVRDDRT